MSTEVPASQYQPPETLVHSVSPLETSFSLVNDIPAATANVATPRLPQSMLPAATPRTSTTAAAPSSEGRSPAGFPSECTQNDSQAHHSHSPNGAVQSHAVGRVSESGPGANGPESPRNLATDVTPVALAADQKTGSCAPHSHSPVPLLKLPPRTNPNVSTSGLSQRDIRNANQAMDDSSPPPTPRVRSDEPGAGGDSHGATETKHVAKLSNGIEEEQVQEPVGAPMVMGGISHSMSTPEPSNYPSSRSSPTVALITSSLSPQPQTRRLMHSQAAEGAGDACVPESAYGSVAQGSVRDSGEVFDASAHAPRLGTGNEPPLSTTKGKEIETTSQAYRVEGEPNIAGDSLHDRSHGVNEEWPTIRRLYQQSHTENMGTDVPASNPHGAAFVRQELMKRSEEQHQREIDALFNVRCCQPTWLVYFILLRTFVLICMCS